jgi:hypothetical protein
MIKSTVTWKIIKTTFEDAKFLQQDVVEMEMMTIGSDKIIVSFLCLALLSRQTVMFPIRPLFQEKYPTSVKILGYLGRGLGEQMQIVLVNRKIELFVNKRSA